MEHIDPEKGTNPRKAVLQQAPPLLRSRGDMAPEMFGMPVWGGGRLGGGTMGFPG